ncbi:MAG: V-type ATP synthase subunit I [Clostridiaceae bacterium]
MAIVKMNKFTLLALESNKPELLEKLQAFQGVQFINLQEEKESEDVLKELSKVSTDSSYGEYGENLSKIRFAINFIKPYLEKESAVNKFLKEKEEISYNDFLIKIKENSWETYYKELKEKEERLNEIANSVSRIETEITNLKKWDKFDAAFEDLETLKYTSSYLGTIPKIYGEKLLKELSDAEIPLYYEILNEDSVDIFLLLLINNENDAYAGDLLRNMGFSMYQTNCSRSPREEIRTLNASLLNLINEEKNIKQSLYSYADRIQELRLAYDYYNMMMIRTAVSGNFLKTKKILAVSGWNTEESNDKLVQLLEETLGNEYYITFKEADEEEMSRVPIKLENGIFTSNFEMITEMYSLPAYSEVDPTPILSVFYFVFFGMMLSDAGYGLLIIAATSLALLKIKDKERRKTFKLFLFAGISTVFWGALYGSWFGDLFPKYFGINIPYLLDPAGSIMEVFIISLLFGVIHVFVGLGMKGYMLIKAGMAKDAVYDVFTWYATLTGAILMIAGIGGSIGKILLVGGVLGLLLTQGRTSPSLGGKIAMGIYGVYGITGYLGDIVSYSRLLALGLATGFIANALNLIINLVPSPVKYIIAPFLFVGLHLFNLLINALGSYVHAARLQYLEFFSKFYEGGGKKFAPFRISDEFIKITK